MNPQGTKEGDQANQGGEWLEAADTRGEQRTSSGHEATSSIGSSVSNGNKRRHRTSRQGEEGSFVSGVMESQETSDVHVEAIGPSDDDGHPNNDAVITSMTVQEMRKDAGIMSRRDATTMLLLGHGCLAKLGSWLMRSGTGAVGAVNVLSHEGSTEPVRQAENVYWNLRFDPNRGGASSTAVEGAF